MGPALFPGVFGRDSATSAPPPWPLTAIPSGSCSSTGASGVGRTSPLCPWRVLTPDTVLGFLNHLEESRGNTIRTRNARLAALRSFVHYLTDWLGPELPAATRRILTIPFKRQVKPLIGFLTRAEIEAHSGGDR